MKRFLALSTVSAFLLAIYFPLISPIASEAQSASTTRYGTMLTSPQWCSYAPYVDLMMMGWASGAKY